MADRSEVIKVKVDRSCGFGSYTKHKTRSVSAVHCC